jgi:hypothetical protein
MMFGFGFSTYPYYYIPGFLLMLPSFVQGVNRLFVWKKKYAVALLAALFLLSVGWAPVRLVHRISDHYRRTYMTTNSMTGLDQYLSAGRPVIWLDDAGVEQPYVAQGKGMSETYLNYMNTKDIGRNPFITEADLTDKYTGIIASGAVDDEVDTTAVYISFQTDLPGQVKSFANFAPVFEIDVWGRTFVGYVFKSAEKTNRINGGNY